jgi:hypothetical protein
VNPSKRVVLLYYNLTNLSAKANGVGKPVELQMPSLWRLVEFADDVDCSREPSLAFRLAPPDLATALRGLSQIEIAQTERL